MLRTTSALALTIAMAATPLSVMAQQDQTDESSMENSAEEGAAKMEQAGEDAAAEVEEAGDAAADKMEEGASEMEAAGDDAAAEMENGSGDAMESSDNGSGDAMESESGDAMESGSGDAMATDPAAGGDMSATTAEGDSAMEGDSAEEQAKPVEGQIVLQGENSILANELVGATVKSPGDETVGSISDVIINFDGNVEGVVIGVGGFLGIGEKRVAVEISQIDMTTDEDDNVTLTLSSTKADLEAAPEFVSSDEQRSAEQAEQAPATEGAVTEPREPAAQ